jgi:hypothetical protein
VEFTKSRDVKVLGGQHQCLELEYAGGQFGSSKKKRGNQRQNVVISSAIFPKYLFKSNIFNWLFQPFQDNQFNN